MSKWSVYWTVTFKKVIRYCWLFDTFKMLSSYIRYTHMLCNSSEKVVVFFTIVRNLTVTTQISVNSVRADLFLMGIFITEQRSHFTRWMENNFSLQNFKLFSIELTKHVLSCSNLFPIKGRTQTGSFFEAVSTTSFLIKTLSKYFLIQRLTKLLG